MSHFCWIFKASFGTFQQRTPHVAESIAEFLIDRITECSALKYLAPSSSHTHTHTHTPYKYQKLRHIEFSISMKSFLGNKEKHVGTAIS